MRGRPTKGRKSKRSTKARKSKSRSKATKTARGKSSKSKKPSKASKTSKAAAKRKPARKRSPAKKTSGRKTGSRAGRGRHREDVFGEGNYTASREFRRDQTGFVGRNRNRIPQMGDDAAKALEGSEGKELRRAEETARSHSAGDDAD